MVRIFLRFILITMTLGFSSALVAEENSHEIKAVYDLKTGDSKTLERTLISGVMKNSVYYQDQLQEFRVKVVVHGDSYQFFQKDNNMAELGKRLKTLHESYGVEFEICKAGLKKNNIPEQSIYPFVKIIPNATIGLIGAQNKGYAYIPIH
ncbi:MAG: DsrE family protein [Sulfurovum sp.]|nr:DsrE family protein [Sulfurovum sp.]